MQGQSSPPGGSRTEDHVNPAAAAGERYSVDGPAATVARLPFSARVARVPDLVIAQLESDRTCWAVLGVGMALSVGLSMYLTRGITFHADDFLYFLANRGFHLRVLIGPHNGHLIFVPR